jgi:hypothetical protein
MARKLGPPDARGHSSNRERERIDGDGRPFEPPRPTDIEGRPAVGAAKGDDPLLEALIAKHPERDPAKVKLVESDNDDEP